MPSKTTLVLAGGLSLLTLGWMGTTMTGDPQSRDPAKPSTPPRVITVRLLGSAAEITGVAVPAHILAGQRPHFFVVDEPSTVTVAVPGRRDVKLPVKQLQVVVEKSQARQELEKRTSTAIVVDVILLPLPKAVPYRQAVAEARRVLKEMGVEPDEAMRKQMAAWPEDSYAATYSAGMWFPDRNGLAVEVRSPGDDRWFVVLTIAAGIDARRALWDPSFKGDQKAAVTDGGSVKPSF